MIKRRGAPRLTNHISGCSVSSRVVVMVQWLAHLTCNPGNAGSIPTHGICFFHSKWISQYFVLARDYIVGFPVLHSKYMYIYELLLLLASATVFDFLMINNMNLYFSVKLKCRLSRCLDWPCHSLRASFTHFHQSC